MSLLERGVQPRSQPPPVGDALAQRHLKYPQVRHGEVRVRVARQQPPSGIISRESLCALQPHRQLGKGARVILQAAAAGTSRWLISSTGGAVRCAAVPTVLPCLREPAAAGEAQDRQAARHVQTIWCMIMAEAPQHTRDHSMTRFVVSSLMLSRSPSTCPTDGCSFAVVLWSPTMDLLWRGHKQRNTFGFR